MISGTVAPTESTQLLLGDGLPLREPKPLTIEPNAEGEVTHEGPLALEYRMWPTETVPSPRMDVTYTTTRTEVSYDGRTYTHPIDVVDDK